MENLTKRIFIVVIITAIICIGCFGFVMIYTKNMTENYDALVESSLEDRKRISEINQLLYNLQATVASHVVNTDEKKYDIYEERADQCNREIKERIREYERKLDGFEDKELFRDVARQYYSFEAQMRICLEYSRQGAKKTAEYYVCEVMQSYLYDADEAFQSYYEKAKQNAEEAKSKMNNALKNTRSLQLAVIIILIGSLSFCLIVVYRNGQFIVSNQVKENMEHNAKIMEMQYQTILGMANLIESRDGETGEHVKRTSKYVSMIAEELAKDSVYADKITDSYKENLWKAAPLHDIGKIKIPDSILQKPGKLTEEEFDKMKEHTTEGGKIIHEIIGGMKDKDYVDMAFQVATCHHEKWNGTGYPRQLSGEEIPLCARIMAVADVFDALVSKRCYKKAMPVEAAYQIIEESSGSHFDPVIAEAFITLRPKVEEYLKTVEE